MSSHPKPRPACSGSGLPRRRCLDCDPASTEARRERAARWGSGSPDPVRYYEEAARLSLAASSTAHDRGVPRTAIWGAVRRALPLLL